MNWTLRQRELKRNYHNNTSWNIVADGMNRPRGGIQYDNVARRTIEGICGEVLEDKLLKYDLFRILLDNTVGKKNKYFLIISFMI